MILRQARPRTTNYVASAQERGPAPQQPVGMLREEDPGGAAGTRGRRALAQPPHEHVEIPASAPDPPLLQPAEKQMGQRAGSARVSPGSRGGKWGVTGVIH